MSLESRLTVRILIALLLLTTLLFLSAGSLRFWQAWVFIASFLTANGLIVSYFLKHDRRLLERRLITKEKAPQQRLFKKLWIPLWIVALCMPGLDYRFGWSSAYLGGVPLWLMLVSQALVLCSCFAVFQVLKTNSFASSIIQVEAGQEVISTGPYRLVRHPMYSAIILLTLSAPLALGSYLALPVSVLLIPLLVFRLLHEEEMLSQELAGYFEYCRHTRYRLIPFVY